MDKIIFTLNTEYLLWKSAGICYFTNDITSTEGSSLKPKILNILSSE